MPSFKRKAACGIFQGKICASDRWHPLISKETIRDYSVISIAIMNDSQATDKALNSNNNHYRDNPIRYDP